MLFANFKAIAWGLFVVVLMLGMMGLFSGPAYAQVAGATLNGTIADLSGPGVPNANVSIKNTATGVDALVYPHQKCLVLPIGATFQKDRNGIIAALAGFPAIEVPAGFSKPTTDAPIGVPVGMELLGRAWAEPELLRLAFGFEQATHLRKPPVSTPALPPQGAKTSMAKLDLRRSAR